MDLQFKRFKLVWICISNYSCCNYFHTYNSFTHDWWTSFAWESDCCYFYRQSRRHDSTHQHWNSCCFILRRRHDAEAWLVCAYSQNQQHWLGPNRFSGFLIRIEHHCLHQFIQTCSNIVFSVTVSLVTISRADQHWWHKVAYISRRIFDVDWKRN